METSGAMAQPNAIEFSANQNQPRKLVSLPWDPKHFSGLFFFSLTKNHFAVFRSFLTMALGHFKHTEASNFRVYFSRKQYAPELISISGALMSTLANFSQAE